MNARTGELGTRASGEMERELASLIVATLNLEIDPVTIDPTAALFGKGLSLDSIDMLEVALAVSQQYGYQLRSDDPDNPRTFASLRALAAHIEANRTR